MTTSEDTSSDVMALMRSLYPNAPDDELQEEQQALIEYVAVVLRIFDRSQQIVRRFV